MSAPLLVMAAGGTGGHMFPAQALAEAMLAKGWRVKLSTDERGASYTQAFPEDVEIEVVASATFARGGVLSKVGVPFRVLRGIISSIFQMRRDRPECVVGFGGYPSIPAIAAAVVLKRPRVLHEQNGVLGRVNELFAKRVNAIACGTWPTDLPDGVEGLDIGNPVRGAILARAGAGFIAPGDYPMSILVMGGSQGARILSDIVPPAIAALSETHLRHIRVSHQARPEDLERVATYYTDQGIRAEVQSFFTDVPERMSEAQLVISRSGASSVADISVIGRPAILVPFAGATADHQTANARGLAEAGGAIVVQESDLEVAPLAQQIQAILDDPGHANLMAAAALGQGKPDATERLVALVEELAQSGSATTNSATA